MKVKTFGKAIAAGVGALALSLSVTAVPAQADPVPAGFRTLVAVGSDTTFEAVNGLSNVLRQDRNNPSSPLVLASYDPQGGNITTRPVGCSFPRPNGSTAGKQALLASENGTPWNTHNVTGCIDVARSSSAPSVLGTSGTLTYVQFGVDALTYALNADSDLPANMTTIQLQRIYRCLTVAIAGVPVQPRLVQAGSGTRASWNSRMGITDAGIANEDYPCLINLLPVQEHEGAVLNGQLNQIAPMSTGQWISQENSGQVVNGVLVDVLDRRGESVLGRINGVASRTGPGGTSGPLNIAFPFSRDVYNVIPTADLGNPLIADVFLGATSQVCANRPVTEAFGFGFRASTGSQPANLAQQGCGDGYLKANS